MTVMERVTKCVPIKLVIQKAIKTEFSASILPTRIKKQETVTVILLFLILT